MHFTVHMDKTKQKTEENQRGGISHRKGGENVNFVFFPWNIPLFLLYYRKTYER